MLIGREKIPITKNVTAFLQEKLENFSSVSFDETKSAFVKKHTPGRKIAENIDRLGYNFMELENFNLPEKLVNRFLIQFVFK